MRRLLPTLLVLAAIASMGITFGEDTDIDGDLTVADFVIHHDFNAGALSSVGAGAPTGQCCGTICGEGLDNANEILADIVEVPSNWNGSSDMTLHIHTVPTDSDPIAENEDVDLDYEYRSIALAGTGKTGTAVTGTITFTQTGGAGGECDINVFSATVPWNTGNQPLAVADDFAVKFNRNPASESSSYSGAITIYKVELIYNSNTFPSH